MAAKKSGLGRGLDSLFIDNSVENSSGTSAVKMKINDIEPNRDQPRKFFDENALSELAGSIQQHGVLQPLVVRPMSDGSYQLVAGERRWRASKLAGLSEVPVVIKELSDEDAMALALIENLQREDLNAVEEAEGYRLLMDSFGITQEEAAERVGKSRPAVANALRLLKLPVSVSEMVRNGSLSAGHARALLPLQDEYFMLEIIKEITKHELSVRETEKLVKSFGKPKKQKTEKPREQFVSEVELALRSTLSRNVNVKSSKKGGVIEIEYFDNDDLAKLAKMFDD